MPRTPSRTLRLRADRPSDLQQAAAILRAGGLVAFPTETVYGLGANAFSAAAVAGIFTAKQRPAWDPLIVHLAAMQQLPEITHIDGATAGRVQVLASTFWPGPLTLLLPRSAAIPDAVTAGREKVGVRLPAHPVAQALLQAAGVPIAAPSANRFGHVSPTTAQHVLDDLDGRIDAVLDGGVTTVGVESTVLDPTTTPMLIYRAGAVTLEILQSTGLPIESFRAPEASGPVAALPSPGVGLRHYAPEVPLRLSGPDAASLQNSLTKIRQHFSGTLGVLLPAPWRLAANYNAILQPWGLWSDPEQLAAGLFAGLRALEKLGVAAIVCPLPDPGGLREALRDRLLKAAKPRA